MSRESSADSIRQAPSATSSDRIRIDFTEHYRIGWSHYRILLSLEAGLKRQFYFDQSAQQRWSVRELSRQIERALFEPVALSRDTVALVRLEKQRGPVETVRYEDAFKEEKHEWRQEAENEPWTSSLSRPGMPPHPYRPHESAHEPSIGRAELPLGPNVRAAQQRRPTGCMAAVRVPIWRSKLPMHRSSFREVLDCGSPLPLSEEHHHRKRQRAAALQDAGAPNYARGDFDIAPLAS